jgi:uncharacterized damage-inducible protein DinB
MTSTPLPDTVAGPSAADRLFPDLDAELATTRRAIERVPDDRLDWQPHEKSMTLGRLASHLAELPRLATLVVSTPEFVFDPTQFKPMAFGTTAEMLAAYDGLSQEMRDGIRAMGWEQMDQQWTMRVGDHVVLQGPKSAVLRQLGMSHMTHHRAQLGVYLRLLGVAVPKVYGPSADEQ